MFFFQFFAAMIILAMYPVAMHGEISYKILLSQTEISADEKDICCHQQLFLAEWSTDFTS
jgi:hypothetical protein